MDPKLKAIRAAKRIGRGYEELKGACQKLGFKISPILIHEKTEGFLLTKDAILSSYILDLIYKDMNIEVTDDTKDK